MPGTCCSCSRSRTRWRSSTGSCSTCWWRTSSGSVAHRYAAEPVAGTCFHGLVHRVLALVRALGRRRQPTQHPRVRRRHVERLLRAVRIRGKLLATLPGACGCRRCRGVSRSRRLVIDRGLFQSRTPAQSDEHLFDGAVHRRRTRDDCRRRVIGSMGTLREIAPVLVHMDTVAAHVCRDRFPGVLLALALLTIREPVRDAKTVGTRDRSFSMREVIAFLWRDARSMCASIGMALIVIVLYALPAWMPSFLMRAHGPIPSLSVCDMACWC